MTQASLLVRPPRPGRSPPGRLVALAEAHRCIEEAECFPAGRATVPLLRAVGRCSAREVLADFDRPEGAVSAMDGYAYRGADRGLTRRIRPAKPGRAEALPLGPGEAVPISTGDPLPPGADAIVRVEAAHVEAGILTLHAIATPGADIRPAGEDLPRGTPLLAAGERVRPAHVAILADQGRRTVEVIDPAITFLAVGGELRALSDPGAAGRLDFLTPLFTSWLAAFRVRSAGIVEDHPEALLAALGQAVIGSDLVVTVGGASVGEGDIVKPTIRAHGELWFEGVSTNLLKRAAAGRFGRVPVLVLPGQPLAAVTAFHEFGLHCLERLTGVPLRRTEELPLAQPIAGGHRMNPVHLFRIEAGQLIPLPWGAGRYRTLLQADAFASLEKGARYDAGDRLRVERFWPA